jgi:hypothetical protein
MEVTRGQGRALRRVCKKFPLRCSNSLLGCLDVLSHSCIKKCKGSRSLLLTCSNINILCKDINKTGFKYYENKDGLRQKAPKIRVTISAGVLKSFICFYLRGREWNFSPNWAAFWFVPALEKAWSHSIW